MVCSAEKQGVVQEIRHDGVLVRLVLKDACTACCEKGCSMHYGRISDVFVPCGAQTFIVGDRVRLTLPQSRAFRALWWAYLLPLALMLVTLAAVSACTGDEVLSGVSALFVLLPYYLLLWLLRGRMRQSFQFGIEKEI